MNVINNPYDSLYTNLKNRFTVVNDGRECSVGDYMRMKAGASATRDASLPVSVFRGDEKALATIVSFVNDRLTVKNPPVKDRTIRSFPIRTSLSAILSAVAVCALVMSCGIFALTGSRGAVTGELAEAPVAVIETEAAECEETLTENK